MKSCGINQNRYICVHFPEEIYVYYYFSNWAYILVNLLKPFCENYNTPIVNEQNERINSSWKQKTSVLRFIGLENKT